MANASLKSPCSLNIKAILINNNLGVLSDTAIENLNNKFLAASVLALKHSHEKEWLEQNAGQLLLLALEGRKSSLWYLTTIGDCR